MKEKPILFNTPMVKAILEGRKAQTRRVLKPQPYSNMIYYDKENWRCVCYNDYLPPDCMLWNPYKGKLEDCAEIWGTIDLNEFSPYQVGDRLWVKEGIMIPPYITDKMLREGADTWPSHVYKTDLTQLDIRQWKDWGWKHKTARFMNKDYTRIWLEVTGVRAERLQDISEEDAHYEGIYLNNTPWEGWYWMKDTYSTTCPIHAFELLWDSINSKKYPWSSNPWVWVIEFKRVS